MLAIYKANIKDNGLTYELTIYALCQSKSYQRWIRQFDNVKFYSCNGERNSDIRDYIRSHRPESCVFGYPGWFFSYGNQTSVSYSSSRQGKIVEGEQRITTSIRTMRLFRTDENEYNQFMLTYIRI